MILVCWDEISTHPAGTGFTLRFYGKFHTGMAGQSSTWYLFKFVFIFRLIFLCKHILINFFMPLWRVEAITWEKILS